MPIYLKHQDDDLESTMVNSFIDKHQNINDYVEYLYEKSSWTSLETTQKALTNNQKKFSKILVKDPVSKFSLSIYNDFRNNILPKYRQLEKEHDLLMKTYLKKSH